MKKDEIHLDDWQRILFGGAPPEYLIEVLLRTIVIYAVLLVIVRYLGKRMSGQLSLTEMAVMLSAGAIISPSMQAPDRGVILGILAMICMFIYQRGTTLWEVKKPAVETLMQGTTSILVKDGVLQLDEMKATRISKEQIFAVVRNNNVYNLGNVNRLYLEPSGTFSMYQNQQDTKPGLSTLPETDEAIHTIQKTAEGTHACDRCGNVVPTREENECPVCHHMEWVPAIL